MRLQSSPIHASIGVELIDTGVNMGPHRATEYLKHRLNGFNNTDARYHARFIDGLRDEQSLGALAAFLK